MSSMEQPSPSQEEEVFEWALDPATNKWVKITMDNAMGRKCGHCGCNCPCKCPCCKKMCCTISNEEPGS